MTAPRAVLAEDEPLLSYTLSAMLGKLWPELEISAIAENGVKAVELALNLRPDILFLDIKMPGKTGLEVAQELAEEWPDDNSFPHIVFVTAYDDYAVEAFEQSAADYVLKPINEARLGKTIDRLKTRLQARAQPQQQTELDRVMEQLRTLVPVAQNNQGASLSIIRAAVGNQVRMIPVQDVLYFEATDKYINVVTAEHASLIRMSLRELLPQLDNHIFWQIHRGTVVNTQYVQSALRDESGKVSLKLKNRDERLQVSRIYAHLFRQM